MNKQFNKVVLIPVGNNYFAFRDGVPGEFVFEAGKVNPAYEHVLASAPLLYMTLECVRGMLQNQLDNLEAPMPTKEANEVAVVLSNMYQLIVDAATVALRSAELGTVQVGNELGTIQNLAKKF